MINHNAQFRLNSFKTECRKNLLYIESEVLICEYVQRCKFEFVLSVGTYVSSPHNVELYAKAKMDEILKAVDGLQIVSISAIANSSFSIILFISSLELPRKPIELPSKKTVCNLFEIDSMGGFEFEQFILKVLKENSILAENTSLSNDQGVDVIAQWSDNIIAIQCKRYQDVVGNYAVQQVYAGEKIYNACCSIVITNNYYTDSAEELAEKCKVLLVDRDSLKDFIENPLIYIKNAINLRK